MFNSDNKKKLKQQDDVMIERNRIAHKTTFKGEIISEGDFRIDGVVEGDLSTTGKVIIGAEGKIYGKVKCVNADIHGLFDGHLEVKNSLCLRPTAKVSGNVYMESLTVEPGAEFNANCKMLSTIKELNTHKVEATKENKQQVSKIS